MALVFQSLMKRLHPPVLTPIQTLMINKRVTSPSNSFRVRVAISLISMRDREREWVAEIRGAGGIVAGAGVVSTLLTRGDLRGLSMLRPTRLHRGILNMCLHAASPKVMIHKNAIRAKAGTECRQGDAKKERINVWHLWGSSKIPGFIYKLDIQRLHAAT